MSSLAKKLMSAIRGSSIDVSYITQWNSSSPSDSISETMSFGDADADRIIIACIATAHRSSSPTFDTVTIGGVTATQRCAASSGNFDIAIYTAPVPTGTSGTVAVTFTGTGIDLAAIALFRLIRPDGAVPDDADASASTGISTSVTLTSSGGVAVAIVMGQNAGGGGGASISNIDESFSSIDVQSGEYYVAGINENFGSGSQFISGSAGYFGTDRTLLAAACWS